MLITNLIFAFTNTRWVRVPNAERRIVKNDITKFAFLNTFRGWCLTPSLVPMSIGETLDLRGKCSELRYTFVGLKAVLSGT